MATKKIYKRLAYDPLTHRRLGMIARSRGVPMTDLVHYLVSREFSVEFPDLGASESDLAEAKEGKVGKGI